MAAYVKKFPNGRKWPNRKSWLKEHPEDQWIDDENQRARKTGYYDDDVKHLMVAICARACDDYKRASLRLGLSGDSNHDRVNPETIMDECRQFFRDDIFQHFVNRMPVEKIEKMIMETPLRTIQMCMMEQENEPSKEVSRFAKNTKPIIEEQCDEQGS